MPRPKGSKNKKTAACHLPRKKSQFANTKMADQLHADFKAHGGLHGYRGLHDKYKRLFDTDYFCLISFDVAWKRLLAKVKEIHGVDYLQGYTNMLQARAKRAEPKGIDNPDYVRRRRTERIMYHADKT